MDELLRKTVKRDFNRLATALLLSQLLIVVVSNAVMLLHMSLLRVYYPLDSVNALWNMAYESGWMIIIAASVGVLPPLLLSVRSKRFESIPDENQSAGLVRPLFYLLLLLGLQMIIWLTAYPFVIAMEEAGYSFSAASQSASAMSSTGTMLFYSIAVAPICEELVYRGFVLRYLERYGRWFAVSISAFLFALMHGNIVQFPIALVAGLLFGYITVQYSIHTAIAVHIGNNLFVEGINRLSLVDAQLSLRVDSVVSMAALLVTLVALVLGVPAMIRWVRANKSEPHVFRWFFSCWPVLLLVAYLIYQTLSSLTYVG